MELSNLHITECFICEQAEVGFKIKAVDASSLCDRYLREEANICWLGIHKFSVQNKISPGFIPQVLLGEGKLSPIEAIMLALVHLVIQVYKVQEYGQYKGGKVHVSNFFENPPKVFHIIPRLPHELPVVILWLW